MKLVKATAGGSQKTAISIYSIPYLDGRVG